MSQSRHDAGTEPTELALTLKGAVEKARGQLAAERERICQSRSFVESGQALVGRRDCCSESDRIEEPQTMIPDHAPAVINGRRGDIHLW
jgi:hypothetical protein